MHNGVISSLGLPIRYIGVELSPGHLREFFTVVRAGNFLGGNVTIPFKEEAAKLADERSEAVEACGAANVIVVKNGRLFADNTDGCGFMDALRSAGWGRRLGSVVVLGAGGSARGIVYELFRKGARRIVILNRDPARAAEIARSMHPRFPSVRIDVGELETIEMINNFHGADLVVQCTSLGLSQEWKNFPVSGIEKKSCFADIVYRRGGTSLVRRLRKRGVPAIDGLGMLAHQAARSFYLWTGRRVPGDEFLSIAQKTIAIG
jgi:shikimate dehydrogenase